MREGNAKRRLITSACVHKGGSSVANAALIVPLLQVPSSKFQRCMHPDLTSSVFRIAQSYNRDLEASTLLTFVV
jgi:hypothetical protein